MPKHASKTAAARKSDDLAVRMLKMRANGASPAEIGRRIGKSQQFVSTATNRIRRADEAESKDPQKELSAAYW